MAGPMPPPPKGNKKKDSFGGYHKQDLDEYKDHAEQVRALSSGTDFVENEVGAEKRPAAFDRKELEVVRSWVQKRPLEPKNIAAAKIEYPRSWNTKRGRYSKFSIPGTKGYGLFRARPTF